MYHQKIAEVYDNISPFIVKTPLIPSLALSQITNANVLLKCENLQYTHSFKVRGAFNKISKIKDKKNKIAIATSGGNHGMAVAYAAQKFNMPAVIVVPEFVPAYRIELIKQLGAKVIVFGNSMDELNAKVAEYTQDPNYIYVHPFDDDDVIAGQATIAYEILLEQPDIDVIVASIGGGGLISGIAQYAKSFNPNIKVYGVQTIGADAMSKSIQAKKIVAIPKITSIATSLGATKITDRTFVIVQNMVNRVFTVTDEEAIKDLVMTLDSDKLLVEPASSCVISLLISNKIGALAGQKIALILCGGNISLAQLKSFI